MKAFNIQDLQTLIIMQTLISQFVEIRLQLMLKDVIWQTWFCLNISDAQFYYMFLAMC